MVPDLRGETRPDLLDTIEQQIIPRLVMAHTAESFAVACPETRLPPTPEEIEGFSELCIAQDLAGALQQVDGMCRQGLGLESILLNLIAPAARLLGEHWENDLRSWNEVTIGLGTLQQIIQVLGPSFAPNLSTRGLVVLVAAPHEQHTLGLYLVGEFIRRAGFGVLLEPTMTEANLLALVASEHVEAVGMSVSAEEHLPAVGRILAAVRRVSTNRDIGVLLGGCIPLKEFAAKHGASVCAQDPHEAVLWLEQHVRSAKS